MHIEYEISQKDFVDGQRLAIKKSTIRVIRWMSFVMPTVGLVLLIFLISVGVRQGLSVRLVPGLVMSLWFLSIPLLNRRGQKKVYAKSTSMHGELSLDVDEAGIRFLGPTFSSNVSWDHFSRFLEDDKVFVLYQKGDRIFNILPKRTLTPEQMAGFRQLAEHHLNNKS